MPESSSSKPIVDSLLALVLCGSARRPSYSRGLADAISEKLETAGFEAVTWELAASPLPPADPRYHHDPISHPDLEVGKLVTLADRADAFVLVSPVYHNSYSGVLKNALDHLAIPQFHHKAVGLACHGSHRTTQPVDHLRIVVRGLLGIAIPTQICTAEEDFDVLEDGMSYHLTTPALDSRLDRFSAELAWFARFQTALRASLATAARTS